MEIDLSLWRARCRETSYERANRLADEATARQWQSCDGWWMDRGLWQEPGRHHSQTEMLALAALLIACPKVLADAVARLEREDKLLERQANAEARQLVRAVLHKLRDESDLQPLRDVMARRGETMAHVAEYDHRGRPTGRMMWTVVKVTGRKQAA